MSAVKMAEAWSGPTKKMMLFGRQAFSRAATLAAGIPGEVVVVSA